MTATTATAATLAVTVERDLPYPPEKVWRALTTPHLIAEWLMQNDFQPQPGHRFDLRADWGQVACQVVTIEPDRVLSYTWASYGLESLVTWTLAPSGAGTRLRMDHTGFRPDQQQAYQGAGQGWPRFIARLEEALARAG